MQTWCNIRELINLFLNVEMSFYIDPGMIMNAVFTTVVLT